MNKPTKPNIVIPESFAKNGIKTDFDSDLMTEGFDNLKPDVLAGDNLNKFIDDTYKGLNYAMAGTDAINLIQEDEVLTYKDGELVSDKLANLKNKLTNCILEAPNGVAEISGSNIIFKQGLKVLMPNGLNADGTLKNLEYTLQQDVKLAISTDVEGLYFGLLFENATAGNRLSRNFLIQETEPTAISGQTQYWYNPRTNLTYSSMSDETVWHITRCIPICTYHHSSSTLISNFNYYSPINLLKQSDKPQISGWGMPSDKYIDLTLGASGSTYTAPANGYYTLAKYASSNGQFLQVSQQSGIGHRTYAPTGGDLWITSEPIIKGKTISITYTANGKVNLFRFYYAEGEV